MNAEGLLLAKAEPGIAWNGLPEKEQHSRVGPTLTLGPVGQEGSSSCQLDCPTVQKGEASNTYVWAW